MEKRSREYVKSLISVPYFTCIGNMDTPEPWLLQGVDWKAWNDVNKKVNVECANLNQNICDSNPCTNGKCYGVENNFYCHCDPNWIGRTCDVPSKSFEKSDNS